MIAEHPYAFCLLWFTLGTLAGTFGILVRAGAQRAAEIMRRIEACEDLLIEHIEGGRMQYSSTSDAILHKLDELKELMRYRFFLTRR